MKILAYPTGSAARYFRLDPIGKYIMRGSANSFYVSLDPMSDNDLGVADVVILQQTCSPERIKQAKEHSIKEKKLLVAELDDYFTINEDNPRYEKFVAKEAEKWLEVLCGVADVITTTTDYLANTIKRRLKKNKVKKDVVVLPNYLDMEMWDLPILGNYSDEIRLLWAGSASHRDDMKFIVPVIKRICEKYPQVKFLYCGDFKLKPLFEGINSEYIDAVPFEAWPAKLHSLRADIGVVPLLDNEFNRCKSNLKYLEFGISGIPSVYSNVVYEKTVRDSETGFIAETEDDFFEKLCFLIESPELIEKIAAAAYLDVKTNYDLKDHALDWLNTYWYYLSKKKTMKIDVGAGIQPIVGANYVHLDANPQCGEIVVDLLDGIPFADGTAERLRCSAILEHIYPDDLKEKVLPEFLRVLKGGGSLYIVVPDWDKIKKSDDWEAIQDNLYGMRHDYIPAKYDLHKYCFNFKHLKKILEGAGFRKVKEIEYTDKAHDPRFTLAVECVR